MCNLQLNFCECFTLDGWLSPWLPDAGQFCAVFRYKTRDKEVCNETHEDREKIPPVNNSVTHCLFFRSLSWERKACWWVRSSRKIEMGEKWVEGVGYVWDHLKGSRSKRWTCLGAVCWWRCWQCELYWKTWLQWSEAVRHHVFGLTVVLRGENWMNLTHICKQIEASGKVLTASGRNLLIQDRVQAWLWFCLLSVSWKDKKTLNTCPGCMLEYAWWSGRER